MASKAAKPKKRVNPAKQIQDRTHVRAQKAASEAASRAGSVVSSSYRSSVAPSDRSGSVAPSSVSGSVSGSPPPKGKGPQRKCKNAVCDGTRVGPEGVCLSCGTVVHEDANIVNEIGFSETSGGAAYVTGVNVGFGEAGPRMSMQIGGRQIAGNGGGRSNQATIEQASLVIATVALKCGREAVGQGIEQAAKNTFARVQMMGWVRGRTIDRVAAACLYYAVRHSEFTGVMLIDIADAINTDVFILGRVFKHLLKKLHGVDDGTGKIVIKNCPFTTLYPEDIIRVLAARLGFDRATEKVQLDAVRILQRMDRDWIVSGRKPAGTCGAALVIAARMNNFRRTVMEICYAAKVGESTVLLRLEEFTRVGSARLTVSDFIEKPFTEEAHDPPAFYRQSKEYIEEQEKKKAERAARKLKRKRAAAANDAEDAEDAENEEPEAGNPAKKQRNGNGRATASPEPRTDADGFAIPALPNSNPAPAEDAPDTTQEDITEAAPLDEADEELALASKYGDFPIPGAKEIRKNRLQGSAMREPECNEEDKLTPAEEESMKLIMEQINNPESEIYKAAASYAEVKKETLMAALQSTRPIQYQEEDKFSSETLDEDEFKDDPEVQNCLLGEEERKIKERVWLNENKEWLRQQQEKAFKAKTAPPKKSRRKNVRKPRIGEGQLGAAESPQEAAREAIERRQISTRLVYKNMQKVFSKDLHKGPGSAMGSAENSAAPSRAGSPEEEEEESEEEWDEDLQADEEVELVEYDEQTVEDDGEEFGGGDDGDDN